MSTHAYMPATLLQTSNLKICCGCSYLNMCIYALICVWLHIYLNICKYEVVVLIHMKETQKHATSQCRGCLLVLIYERTNTIETFCICESYRKPVLVNARTLADSCNLTNFTHSFIFTDVCTINLYIFMQIYINSDKYTSI